MEEMPIICLWELGSKKAKINAKPVVRTPSIKKSFCWRITSLVHSDPTKEADLTYPSPCL